MGWLQAVGNTLGGIASGLGSAFDSALGAWGRPAKARKPKDMLTVPTETIVHEAPTPTMTGFAPLADEEPEPLEYLPAERAAATTAPVVMPSFELDPAALKREPDLFGEYLDKWTASDLDERLGPWKIPLLLTAAVAAYLILRG